MRKIPLKGIPTDQLTTDSTVIGLDVAANRNKGLRCSLRSDRGVWETTLKLRQPVTLCSHYPYVDIPLPNGRMTAEYLHSTFDISPDVATSLEYYFRRSQCVAIDSPAAFSDGERRVCETIWHNHLIESIKPKLVPTAPSPPRPKLLASQTSYLHSSRPLYVHL